MKKTDKICFWLCVLLLLPCFRVSAATESVADASIAYGCNTVDGATPLLGADTPIENLTSAIMYEVNTQTLLCTWNADEQMYPASLVKIMTALIAIEEGVMTDAVAVTEQVLSTLPENAVSADLVADEVIGVQELLYCMLVGSANDAAAVLADHIGGSQEAFVTKMNQRAAELGCTNTIFTDAHGLDSEQYTTARDMARILAEAAKNQQFMEIFGTVDYVVPATNKSAERALSTGNYLLSNADDRNYYDERVTGSRTGVMDSGERCIASVAEENGMQLVTVLLGAKSTYNDDGYTINVFGGYLETSALLDRGFDGFETVQLFYPNQALLQNSVENGNADVTVGPQIAASTVIPSGFTQDDLTYKYSDVQNAYQAPIEKGEKQSVVQVWYGNICLAQVDLFAMNRVATKPLSPIVVDSGDGTKFFQTLIAVIGIIVGVLLCVMILLWIVRRLRFTAAKKRSRRHSKNRRRSR